MMKTLLSATALMLVVSSPVMAASGAATPAKPAAVERADSNEVVQKSGQIDAARLMGRNIQNEAGDKIGEIESVLIGRDGKIQAVIAGVGGFLGIGEHRVAIDWNDLKIMDNGERVLSNMSKDQLKAMPAFAYARDRDTDRNREMARDRDTVRDRDTNRVATADGDRARTPVTGTAVTTAETRSDAPNATMATPRTANNAVVNRDAARTPESMRDSLGRMRADELIGKNVVNARGETVGEIEDIVIDGKNKAVNVVVSVGGFLGMGDKDVVIPFDQLSMNERNAVLMSEKSVDQLKQLPAYKKDDNWRSVERDRPIAR